MDQILQGLEGVICCLDDMLIMGKNDKEHMVNLEMVLSSEDCALESSVVRVINPCERWESSEELQESSSTSLVAREILQEAPELLTLQLALLLRGAILFESINAPSKDRKLTNDQEELLYAMEKKFGELPPREDAITVLKSAKPKFQGANIEEMLLKEVKELSDGDIKVAISTVHMNLEQRTNESGAAATEPAQTPQHD
ncbi:protein prune homolog 2-like [Polyodon spathula]|uniref:protein prune homolog 2-like n=1 Tax=Polyodon spathula TaxID=7913 RepID=UPI001B7F0D16|nr:protein prune homolog 2-like [Polyodon spathula]